MGDMMSKEGIFFANLNFFCSCFSFSISTGTVRAIFSPRFHFVGNRESKLRLRDL